MKLGRICTVVHIDSGSSREEKDGGDDRLLDMTKYNNNM